MAKVRLDQQMVKIGLVSTRSQAESYIKLGQVKVDGKLITKPGFMVNEIAQINLTVKEQYVSRAALKLESAARNLSLNFKNKVVLDVGASTGGFTDYALRHGAKQVLAVDTGTNQLHPSLRSNDQIDLHEQTDIREFKTDKAIDLVVIDVSFISLRQILPAVRSLVSQRTEIVAMVKPQFEVHDNKLKNRGVIKNERIRRQILKDFETWVQKLFKIVSKADSRVSGEKGNIERFYLLKCL